jgi:hypothetical protein
MITKPSVINPAWLQGITRKAIDTGIRIAKFAGYNRRLRKLNGCN